MALILRFSISTPIEPRRSRAKPSETWNRENAKTNSMHLPPFEQPQLHQMFGSLSFFASNRSRKPPLQAISSVSTSDLTRDESDFFWVDYLVWKLHESAKTFHNALQEHELGRNHSHLSKAWIGINVDEWHRRIAYQAAVFSLFRMVMELAISFQSKPACKILRQKVSSLEQCIEAQLNKRHPKLAKWFKMEQLPILSRYFLPSLEKWSSDYSESLCSTSKRSYDGVLVIVLTTSCCVAVRRLGATRVSCRGFTMSIPGSIRGLMALLRGLVPVEALHAFACKAGFEQDFLSHFGGKVLRSGSDHDAPFWMGLVQRKLVVGLQRENVPAKLNGPCNVKVVVRDLATFGLFAHLGRRTRQFLTSMGINDLNEPLKGFLSYLECGCLFFYNDFSSVGTYQLFMEVVTEEIGWLDFYTAFPGIRHQDRKRSKQHIIQAEKEIILSTALEICSDMFSSFTHYAKSSQQSLHENSVAFIKESERLLSTCLKEYWTFYEFKSRKSLKITKAFTPMLELGNEEMVYTSTLFRELEQDVADVVTKGSIKCVPQEAPHIRAGTCSEESNQKSPHAQRSETGLLNMLEKYSYSMLSKISDIWTGTRLLCIDLSVAADLIWKKTCGSALTVREAKKISRAGVDITCVIPLTILMLLPITAIGHAALFAAIKRYIPCLIPSPYSTERMEVVRQLEREIKRWQSSGHGAKPEISNLIT